MRDPCENLQRVTQQTRVSTGHTQHALAQAVKTADGYMAVRRKTYGYLPSRSALPLPLSLHPTEGRRLSWPEWMVRSWRRMSSG